MVSADLACVDSSNTHLGIAATSGGNGLPFDSAGLTGLILKAANKFELPTWGRRSGW